MPLGNRDTFSSKGFGAQNIYFIILAKPYIPWSLKCPIRHIQFAVIVSHPLKFLKFQIFIKGNNVFCYHPSDQISSACYIQLAFPSTHRDWTWCSLLPLLLSYYFKKNKSPQMKYFEELGIFYFQNGSLAVMPFREIYRFQGRSSLSTNDMIMWTHIWSVPRTWHGRREGRIPCDHLSPHPNLNIKAEILQCSER